jgi:hypothetical protein
MPVESFSDWVRLPELGCPRIGDAAKKGSIYTVYKVGFLAIPVADIPLNDLPGVSRQAGKYLLPTIELQFADKKQLCRLPLPLTDWAIDLVALAQQAGKGLFPAKVEFGVLDDRHYAEVL